jgi:glycosyltransferase involved in cell wall biosynthesis
MHVLALTHLFFPARGGTEIALFELAKRLVERGHRVTVITSNQRALEGFKAPRPNSSLAAEEIREGMRIIRLPLFPRQRFILAKIGALALRSRLPGGAALWFMTHVPYLPQMIKTARRLKPDLIYAVPFPTATIFYASAVARKTGSPWVIQPHIHLMDINLSLKKIIQWLFPKASAIMTNTTVEKDFLRGLMVSEEKIHALGQGIALSLVTGGDGLQFRNKNDLSDKPIILFLGRKVENKGIETLIEAMPLIWEKQTGTVLVLAGQSSPYFQALFGRHPFFKDPRIISLDDFPEEEKADLLAACDLLILPSRVESFGVVFLEAWANSKPVIGARIPAVEEMVDEGEDGFLIRYGDHVHLAAVALKLIEDPTLRKNMGEKGKRKVLQRYEINRVTDRMEALFLSLIRQ